MNLRSKINNMNESSTLDVEHIAFQFNRPEMTNAIESMESIVNEILTNSRVKKDDINKDVVKLSKSLSILVGFNVSIVYSPNANFCTAIVPSKVSQDVILKNTKQTSEYYESLQDDGSTSDQYYRKLGTIDSMLKSSYDTVDKALGGSGIRVDLNKAQISGLSNDYSQLILVDFIKVIKEYSLNARECMACILHEVGHTFMYFSHLTKTSTNVYTLLDTIKSEYIDKGNSGRETIAMMYSTMTGTKASTIESMKDTEIVIDILRTVIGGGELDTKEVEYTADVFASRFGYGLELTTALAKMIEMNKLNETFYWHNTGVVIVNTIGMISATLVTLLGFLTIPVGGVLLILLGKVILSIVMSLDLTYKKNVNDLNTRYNNTEYDSVLDRVSRIRRQMIASLKASEGIDNNTVKSIITSIDTLSTMIGSMRHNRSLTEKVKSIFSKRFDRLDTIYLVEELMNSNLSVSLARIKIK